jgi:predicted MPP superfamily phosphohydrolase
MKFGVDNTFRVVQLSDLLSSSDSTTTQKTAEFIEKLLDKEKPDLVVITGDTVDPEEDWKVGRVE